MKNLRHTGLLMLGLLVGGLATQAMAQETETPVVVETRTHQVKIKVEEENNGYRVSGTRKNDDGETVTFDKFYSEHGAWREDAAFKEFTGLTTDQLSIHHEGGIHVEHLKELEEELVGEEGRMQIIVEQLGLDDEELELEEEDLLRRLEEMGAAAEAHSRNVEINVETDGDQFVVTGTRTINGETESFSKTYDSKGEWKDDPEFQEFSGHTGDHHGIRIFVEEGDLDGAAIEHKIRVLEEEAMQGDGEHEVRVIRLDGGNVSSWTNEEGNVFVFNEEEGDGTTIEIKVDGTEGENAVFVVKVESMFIETEDGNHIIIRTDSDESEEITLSRDIIEKADLQNGKPLGPDAFQVFPNPNSGEFSVELSNEISEPLQVRIVDLQGREVFNQSFEKGAGVLQAKINLQGQETGVYILQAVQGDKVSTRKIVVE